MPNPIKPIECELWIAMNEDGGWAVVTDESDALSTLADEQGGDFARVVKFKILMTPPQVPEVSVTVPDETGQTVDVGEVR
jgi:hypothetical protein